MAAAKAYPVTAPPVPERPPTEADARAAFNDLVLLALPITLYKQLSDAAMKRNLTLQQLLSNAVQEYLKKTE